MKADVDRQREEIPASVQAREKASQTDGQPANQPACPPDRQPDRRPASQSTVTGREGKREDGTDGRTDTVR